MFENKKQYFISLPVSFLDVDNSYQKPLSMAHVRKIIKDFDPMGLGQIHVSKRSDGTYWVFDGQHRTAACRELNIKKIDCIVYEGLTIEEESKGYVYYNNTMKQTQLQKFKAELLAGVPEAHEINSIAQSAGLGIDYERNGEAIKAVGALKDIYFKRGAKELKDTLTTLGRSFGTNKHAYQAYVIKGVHKFINDYQNNSVFELEWLINRYKKFGITKLIQLTNEYSSVSGGSKKDAVSMASIKIYNYNKSKNKKIQ